MKVMCHTHDERWKQWADWHEWLKPTILYCGHALRSDLPRHIDYPRVIYHDEWFRHGSFRKRIHEVIDDNKFYMFTEYDCFVMDKAFTEKTEEFMEKEGYDMVTAAYRYEDTNKTFKRGGEPKWEHFSIGVCHCWSKKGLSWYAENFREDVWVEVDLCQTPVSGGLKVGQNPFISPESCNFDIVLREQVEPKGMVWHPIKEQEDRDFIASRGIK